MGSEPNARASGFPCLRRAVEIPYSSTAPPRLNSRESSFQAVRRSIATSSVASTLRCSEGGGMKASNGAIRLSIAAFTRVPTASAHRSVNSE